MGCVANVDYFSAIVFEVRRWEDMESAAHDVEQLLSRRHVQLGKQSVDFQVQNQKQLIEAQSRAAPLP